MSSRDVGGGGGGLSEAWDEAAGAQAEPGEERPAAQVLADRVASALVHHEPGWRLPRRSALARRYGVSAAEMEVAIEELASRHLVRRLPDGQVYRASPADYLIRLEGLPGFGATVDPMGTMIDCASRNVSWRRVPEDIGGVLGLEPGDSVCVVRCLWTADGAPAAFSATYLPEQHAPLAEAAPSFAAVLTAPRVPVQSAPPAEQSANGGTPSPARPGGLHVELQPPAPSVARSLRLTAGQPAVTVTVRFDEAAGGAPVALAIAVLRPDMFRVVIESPLGLRTDGEVHAEGGLWTHAAGGWEP
ncbi:MAG TPA: UTRA domain-containing protein [Streptosporangiaceae bacterium]